MDNISKPDWVNNPVFNHHKAPSTSGDNITYKVVNNVKNIEHHSSVTIVENAEDHKWIRMEIHNGSVSSAMAANYIMISIEEGRDVSSIQQEILTPQLVASITEGRDSNGEFYPMVWLEQCADMKSLAAIHIFPPSNIELFDKVLKQAALIGLKPFPDYINIRN